MLYEYKGKRPVIGNNVFIAPTATIIGDVEVGDGSSIWYGAVLRGDMDVIRIGKNTNIQDNSIVHTDFEKPALVGDNVTIGHNAIIHGCTIEEYCLIGLGAIILNGAHIGRFSVVAAGSVVRENQQVESNQLVAGIPAVLKKEFTEADAEILKRPVENYLELKAGHMSSLKLIDPCKETESE